MYLNSDLNIDHKTSTIKPLHMLIHSIVLAIHSVSLCKKIRLSMAGMNLASKMWSLVLDPSQVLIQCELYMQLFIANLKQDVQENYHTSLVQ